MLMMLVRPILWKSVLYPSSLKSVFFDKLVAETVWLTVTIEVPWRVVFGFVFVIAFLRYGLHTLKLTHLCTVSWLSEILYSCPVTPEFSFRTVYYARELPHNHLQSVSTLNFSLWGYQWSPFCWKFHINGTIWYVFMYLAFFN